MTRKPWIGDPGQLAACFVASLITGRLFLNVLGVGKKGGRLVRFVPQNDDVTIDALGGLPIDPATLAEEEQTLFFNFLKMADKAAMAGRNKSSQQFPGLDSDLEAHR